MEMLEGKRRKARAGDLALFLRIDKFELVAAGLDQLQRNANPVEPFRRRGGYSQPGCAITGVSFQSRPYI